MEDIILIGFGGHAKSVIDSIEQGSLFRIIGYTDTQAQTDYRGYKYLGNDSILSDLYRQGVRKAFVAIGYLGTGTKRKKLYKYLTDIGYEIPAVIDDSSIIARDAVICKGAFIGKGAIVNSGAKIEKMAIINTGAIVEHDCTVGENSHISVGTVLCGNVVIGQESFVGAKSTVIQNLKIGNQVIIGAGSTVLSHIPDHTKISGIIKNV